MPGGMTRLDMIYAGAKEGSSEAYQGPNVVLAERDENGKWSYRIEPRPPSGLIRQDALINTGLERARMLPHVATSGLKAAPTQIGALYKPIHELAGVAADGFRRAQLPRITGLEGSPTLEELIQDAIAGAKIGVGFMPPPPWGVPPPYKDLGGLLGWLAGQLWGGLNTTSRIPGLTTDKMSEVIGGLGTYTLKTVHNFSASELRRCSDNALQGNAFYDPLTGQTSKSGVIGVQFTPQVAECEYKCGAGTSTLQSVNIGKIQWINPDGTLQNPTYVVAGAEVGIQYGSFNKRTFKREATISQVLKGTQDLTPYAAAERAGLPPIKPLPALPALPGTPEPMPSTDPAVPQPEPSPVPTTPGPVKPPIAPPLVQPNRPGTVAPPVPSRVIVIRPNGTVAPTPAELPPVTDPDAHYPIPGKPPITGNGPQATPQEMAKELGRLEQKLNLVLNPNPDTLGEWWEKAKLVYELLSSVTAGKDYTLTEKCTPCDGEPYVPKTATVSAPGSLGAIGVLLNRVDALAALMDAQLGLKQQVCEPCRPQLTGEWVTVNFLSDEPSPSGEKPLRKVFRYRDQTAAPLLTHVQHWENFSWKAGPVIVVSQNLPWGSPKVWAESAAEGKRVIAHAAQVAGVDLADPKHKWLVSGTNDPRYGQPGTMRLDTRKGRFVRVTKRPGPDGLPSGLSPGS